MAMQNHPFMKLLLVGTHHSNLLPTVSLQQYNSTIIVSK